MVKSEIYEELLSSQILTIKQLPLNNEIPYNISINKIISHPQLFDNITLLAETVIKSKNITFNKLCATSVSALPIVTNISTSFEKGFFYIDSTGHDASIKDNISNLKIEGKMDIDDNIIVVETVVKKDYLLENIITKLRKFGGNVVGVLIILEICEGEFVGLIDNKENIIKVLNLYDIFTYLENNNKVDMFASEKLKFFCEKETKASIKNLQIYKSKIAEQIEEAAVVASTESSETTTNNVTKEIFVGQ
jgi:orotate phosphoribosyltransferase